jgi:ubiquinone/menaquinone biosynthesis C-methylase UbiE
VLSRATFFWSKTLMTEHAPSSAVKDHNQVVREEFTRQATAYAANPSIVDPERIARLVQAVQPAPEHRVLEVATGPGYVAMGFAAVAREVVGVDLTEAPLAIAEKRRQELGLHNLRFQLGDAKQLPFADGEFDVVLCRLGFHHFDQATRVLHEMVRVCVPQGTVTVEDLITSEHPARAAYHNRFENLRDPSHLSAFPLSTLLRFFTEAGLEIAQVSTSHMPQVVERWMANAHTPADRAAQVRSLIEQDAQEDLSGTRPFRDAQGQWCFWHHTAIVVGRKLRTAAA